MQIKSLTIDLYTLKKNDKNQTDFRQKFGIKKVKGSNVKDYRILSPNK